MKSPRRTEKRGDGSKNLLTCEGVLLDLGGTLIYGPSIKDVFVKSLRSENLDLEMREDIKRELSVTFESGYDELTVIKRKLLIEVSLYSMLRMVLKRVLETNTRLIEKLRDAFLKLYIETRSAYEDAYLFLEKLKSLGCKIMIVSNVPDHRMALGSLEKLKLINYVDGVLTSAQLGVRKPHPLIYITAIEKLRTSNVVFIGDDVEADVLGPLRVGIPAIHVARKGVRLKRSLSALSNVLDTILT
ncbi:MAG: HAD family hydrolase [Candidatus Nezhaarchaeales archaeon]